MIKIPLTFLVYIITRSDGKRYVGTTNNSRLKARMNSHKVSKAFKNYQFSYKILYETNNISECYEKEELSIKEYDTYNNGLNRTVSGRGGNNSTKFTTLNYKFTEKSKKKMSDTRKALFASGEIVSWNKGVSWSDEARDNFSKVRTGKRYHNKLTKEQVAEIKINFINRAKLITGVGEIQRNGVAMSYIQAFSKLHCNEYGVSSNTIRHIINGKTWKDTTKAWNE